VCVDEETAAKWKKRIQSTQKRYDRNRNSYLSCSQDEASISVRFSSSRALSENFAKIAIVAILGGFPGETQIF